MNAASERREPGNALVALARAARSLPSAALIALEIVGLLAALAVYTWLPSRLYLALPLLSLTTFALWGITDHYVVARFGRQYRLERRLARIFQAIVATLGTVALLTGLFAIVGWAMGIYVS